MRYGFDPIHIPNRRLLLPFFNIHNAFDKVKEEIYIFTFKTDIMFLRKHFTLILDRTDNAASCA